METGSQEFIKFLNLFIQKYPEYKKKNVYLSGESYAGKYLPLFATDIFLYNSNQKDNVAPE